MLAIDDLIPVAKLREMLPSRRPGRKLNYATIWRWAKHGVRGRKLEIVKIGGAVYVTPEALERFANGDGDTTAPARRSPARRDRDVKAAEARLRAKGVRA